ncbi:hypothetical protein BFP76_11215 [Amylibacter kogurei]|uniref:HAD family hydrolase n=1 Tax=Paramylibacter kogurei TaxID=1889778 RepID=A0A2G5KAL3_9RHOB|nr:HAD hydrolase-like protein [Amylibacter kogurei]PIB26475.1 hypothetical protein BFP76_11215 [Amylibacter kogurei]
MFTMFFDLDGTLIDPKVGITSSIQYALTEVGAEVPTADELEWCIGPPLHESFHLLLGEGGNVGHAMELYREKYTADGMYDAEPYDGIGEMFDALHRVDVTIHMATSKPHVFAQEIIEHFGIHAHIERLFGSELDGSMSDKTQLLQYALDETGADPARCVMVGDRRHDVFGAKNNDIPVIGALWGYGEEGELHMAEADMLAGHPEEIPEIAFELMGVSE